MSEPASAVPVLLRSADLRRLWEYWERRRGGRRMPARADIDPAEFKPLIGRVSVIDVIGEDRLSFRFRLAATPFCLALGREMTGKMLDELPGPETRAFLETNYLEVVRTARPLALSGAIRLDERDWMGESLILPLSAEGDRVERLLAAREVSLRRGDRYVPVAPLR